MKKYVITIIILFSHLTGFGQENSEKKSNVFLGGFIGLNQGSVDGLLVDNHISFAGSTRGQINERTGLNVAFLIKYDFWKYLYLKTGLGYTEKGAYVESTLIQDFNGQVNYVSIPFLAGLQVPLSNTMQIMIESGFSINNQVGCKGSDCPDLEDTFTPGSEPGPKLLFENDPVAFMIGFVAEFTLPNQNRLFFTYRRFNHLSEFYGSDKDLRFSSADKPAADFSASHKGFTLGAGLLFPLK